MSVGLNDNHSNQEIERNIVVLIINERHLTQIGSFREVSCEEYFQQFQIAHSCEYNGEDSLSKNVGYLQLLLGRYNYPKVYQQICDVFCGIVSG